MNFFSSDTFLAAAAEAYFDGRGVAPAWVQVAGQHYRVLVDHKGRPLTELPYLDMIEPSSAAPAHAQLASYLSPVPTDVVDVEQWQTAADPHRVVAPFLQWSAVHSWDDFVHRARQAYPSAFSHRTKRRQLAKRCGGDLRFEHHVADRALLEQCLLWKSAQYRRTGLPDLMAGKARRLFYSLFERGALALSALWAGEQALALHVGVLYDGRFYSWLPTYDFTLRACSPGSVLLDEMLTASFQRGDQVYDFLQGGETYKYFYATHVRLIGHVGRAPAWRRAYPAVRERIMQQVRKSAGLHGALQAVKRRLRERALL